MLPDKNVFINQTVNKNNKFYDLRQQLETQREMATIWKTFYAHKLAHKKNNYFYWN